MDRVNFLSQVGQLKGQGDGFRRSQVLPLLTLRLADGTTLTGASNPSVALTGGNTLMVKAVAGQNALGSFVFSVPFDYDKARDELRIKLLVNSSGNTNTPTIGGTAFVKHDGGGTAALTIAASAAINSNAIGAGFVVVNLSGNKLQGGDTITVNLTAGAHAADDVNLHGIELQYRTDLAFYDESLRDSISK
jgi:hypothetical protein